MVAGVSSKRLGLFAGELSGGYQKQSGASAIRGSVDGAVFGGRLFYYPTELLNFALSADQTVGSYGTGSAGSASYTRGSRYELDANYAITSYWTARARAAYSSSRFLTGGTHVDLAIAGFAVSYSFWHNVSLTGEYQYTKSTTNASNANWSENLITAGLTYRY